MADSKSDLGLIRRAKWNVGHAVMNDPNLIGVNAVGAGQDVLAGLRQDHHGVGTFADAPRHGLVMLGRVRQNRVQRNGNRLAHDFEEVEKPFAVLPAEETVLVLYVDQSGGMHVGDLGRAAVGRSIVLDEPRDDTRLVNAALCARLVDRDDVATRVKRSIVTVDDVFGERRDSAFAWRVRSHEERLQRSDLLAERGI